MSKHKFRIKMYERIIDAYNDLDTAYGLTYNRAIEQDLESFLNWKELHAKKQKTEIVVITQELLQEWIKEWKEHNGK